jgi:BirA family transcriptional regulator, biotin operon repressor / biotin---[acetyl-CoA-carboxylase] ligase
MRFAMSLLQSLAHARAGEERARHFVSGAQLAAQFGVTRSAIWKAVEELRALGTEVEAVRHEGYRLALPASPLDVAGVRHLLPPATLERLAQGECLGVASSTNTLLLERGAPPAGRFDFLTAEHQNAGRGRRGRSWLTPPGGAICLSWSWCFDGMAAQLGALSLAIGVASIRALQSLGVSGVQLKWPNDLVAAGGKLGGILIEMRSESAGPVHIVVGLGLNMALGRALRERIDASGNRPVDLGSLAMAGAMPRRNALVAALLHHGVMAMQEFTQQGFQPFRDEFCRADALRDLHVDIQGGAVAAGIARGADPDGALRVEHGGRIHRIIGGEVSVRAGIHEHIAV